MRWLCRVAALALVAGILHQLPARPSQAADLPHFDLCTSFLSDSALGVFHRGQWLVNVKLSAQGTAALAEFTRVHLGEVARVLVGEDLVVETRVQVVVDSGRLQGKANTKEEAEALLRKLRSAPAGPCGSRAPAV